MRINRREFLAVSGGILVGMGALGAGGCAAPRAGAAAPGPEAGAPGAPPRTGDRSLVIIYLGGGNDGLNTVAPYGLGHYYDLRPTLSVRESEALPLDGKVGLHPNLKGIKALHDRVQVAIIQGVGYPNPDRSHFRSFDIWATGRHRGASPVGWLGRYLDLTGGSAGNPLRALAVGPTIPKPLLGARSAAVAIESLDSFQIKGAPAAVQAIKAMYAPAGGALTVVRGQAAMQAAEAVGHLAAGYTPGAAYPERNPLARNLQLIAQLLAGGAGARVLYTSFGGFDEHAGEKRHHDQLMAQFDQAVAAFQQDLEAHGLANRVVTFIFSEFGRRARENGSGGTDHGAAGPALLVGAPVRGGLVGDHPSLTDLDGGDLRMGIDFRSAYATLLEQWLDGPVEAVLGQRYERLPILAG